jgi:hypothetical protein
MLGLDWQIQDITRWICQSSGSGVTTPLPPFDKGDARRGLACLCLPAVTFVAFLFGRLKADRQIHDTITLGVNWHEKTV